MPSLGWRQNVKILLYHCQPLSTGNIRCGVGLKWMLISVHLRGNRLPVRT